MDKFTQDELSFISQVLSQMTWKAGQSQGVVLSEIVIKKCNEAIEQKKTNAEGDK